LSPTGTSSLSPREPLSSVAPPGSTAARTVESPPPVALMAFGSALPLARRYAELLSTTAVDRGILGPREGARIWARHLLNCAAVAELVPGAASVADLGSGAGLPGIVVALLRPDLDMVLIEPMRRRTAFLHECVAALRLDRVEVVQTRAEQLTGRRFDVALARAVAPLPRLLTLSLPLLQPGGSLLALKGAAGTAELAASATELAAAGARGEVRHCGRAWLRHPATVVAVTTPPRRP